MERLAWRFSIVKVLAITDGWIVGNFLRILLLRTWRYFRLTIRYIGADISSKSNRVSKVSRLVKARYEKGVLKLLEPVQLREGEEVYVRLETYEDRVKRLRKYRGILGKAGKEEIEELLLEAEFERL